MSISLYSLGAAQEVTGSKHILEVDGRSFLIDCGAFQGSRAEADRKNREFGIAADKIESVILTHAHYDHCGLLPLLVKNGYNGNIYATPASRDLANLIMMDSARIQARDAEYLRKQAAKKGQRFAWEPLFTEEHVVQAADQMVTISYNRAIHVATDINLEFYDAGHILGSAFAYLTVNRSGAEPVRIVYTGDLGRKNKPIIRDPAAVPAPDYIVMESTYGNRLHEDTQIAMDELAKAVNRAVKSKGKILIPAFAVERTQELVYYFHMLVDQKRIPKIPIYVDSPMATNATSIFQVHPECYDQDIHEAFLRHHKNPFGFNELTFTTNVAESKALNDKPGPMVIISADGMCEAGRIVHHLANNISRPSTTILLVGFMADNTLGRRIQNREKEVRIMNEWHPVRAEIMQINAFSAHADYGESIEWLDSLDTSRLKKIFLVHGEPDAQRAFTEHLDKSGYHNVDIVEYGKVYGIE
ncbi:MAG: MBL fold metallo-hydrolase [Spirochaetaceae bacterium]|jgi:metallo-beta-lactamase family protein|nr:MBL fold metallo-hydrolase [Spirochaetaceae bacterium]